MKIKQSVCIPMMKPPEMPMEDFLAGVAEIGFPAVEIWQRQQTGDIDAFAELCRDKGLVIASMLGQSSLSEGLNDPARHEQLETELRESIEVAARHSIPGIICFSGNRREGLTDEAGIAHTAAGLRLVAPYAEEKGVNLNLELLNSKIDHPEYQCDQTWWGVAVCERANSPRVKLLYDIYHMQIMEGDVIRTIRDSIRWIGHFHTAGVPGRRDIDETQELNYGAVCNAISEAGYDLYVGHEFQPKGDVFESLRRAFTTCAHC
jgi:hydroxypyruvate isomerase